MNIFHAGLLAILQGISEFLPISSSGHLVLFQHILGITESQLLFDIALHVGTLFSVIIFFHKEIKELFVSRRVWLWLIIAGSIPTAVLGFAGIKMVESLQEMPLIVAVLLLINGGWLITASIFLSRKKEGHSINIWHSLLIGAAQGVAILPGISRSGATISTALLLGVDRKESARFSFLLSIPAISGAFLLKVAKSGDMAITNIGIGPILLGIAVSCLVGLAALKFLFKVLEKSQWHWFGIYCIFIGIPAFTIL